jgi:hypothetical protein
VFKLFVNIFVLKIKNESKWKEKFKKCHFPILSKGQKFSTNWFVKNFLQLTYKNDMCPLNM